MKRLENFIVWREIILDFVRKSKLPLKKLCTFVSYFLKRVGPNRQAKKKGRPQKYEDALIITLTLEKVKNEGFNVPSPCDFHYRVKQLDDELLKGIIADATGFGFGDNSPTPATPNLSGNWRTLRE